MITITPGRTRQAQEAPWWPGMQFTCTNCAGVFQIEITDQPQAKAIPNMAGTTLTAQFLCPNCGRQNLLHRPGTL